MSDGFPACIPQKKMQRLAPALSWIRGITDKVSRKVKSEKKKYWRRRLRMASKTLKPLGGKRRGRALLAYRIEPFLFGVRRKTLRSHTMYLETTLISGVLREFGFEVDVIGFTNNTFVPKKRYDLLISSRDHFERYAGLMGKNCIKIAHLDTSHWSYNNRTAYARCREVNRRKPGVLSSYRKFNENRAMEHADLAVILGNDFTISTYETFGKSVFKIPVPGMFLFPEPKKKYVQARKNFIWIGSHGFVQKGLDLVLEAFSEMPEYTLTVCGPIETEMDGFGKAYERELFHTPNIRTLGWVDVRSRKFREIAKNSIGLIYPSCAEGQAGSVVTCMHAGLIPMVSRQCGVDIKENFGYYLEDLSVQAVINGIKRLDALDTDQLSGMARNAWQHAQQYYSKDRYRSCMRQIIGAYFKEKDLPVSGEAQEGFRRL